jgi:hypothetical protein
VKYILSECLGMFAACEMKQRKLGLLHVSATVLFDHVLRQPLSRGNLASPDSVAG